MVYKILPLLSVYFLSAVSAVYPQIIHENLEYSFDKYFNESIISNFLLEAGKLIQNDGTQISEFESRSIEIPIEDPSPFTALNYVLYFSGTDDNNIEVYFANSEDTETWSGWEKIGSHEDFPTENGKTISNLIFLGSKVKFVKFKLIVGTYAQELKSIDSIELNFIAPGESDPDLLARINEESSSGLKTTDDFERPPVVSRTAWGCPTGQNSSWSPSYTTVTHLIVHHSAGSNVSNDWPAVVRAIWTLHTFTNGWGDVGYNYLIDPNGVIYEGRAGGDNAIGAHFCGYNAGTMGTCMMGTYTSVLPTNNALESLKELLAWKCNQRGIDPTGISYHPSSGKNIRHISGHRSGCATECPGTAFYNHLPNFRTEVLDYLLTIPPRVTFSDPVNNQNGFLAYKPIKLSFSQAMDTASVGNSLIITPSGQFSIYWSDPLKLEIRPSQFWQFAASYTLTVNSSALNVFGQKIDGNGNGVPGDPYFLQFTVSDFDNQPPFVERGYPNGPNTSVYAEMKYIFNEVLGQNALIGRVKLFDDNNSSVSYSTGKIETVMDKSVVTFRPSNPLMFGANYRVVFAAGIFDNFGNETTQDIEINFSTGPDDFVQGAVIDDFENNSLWIDPVLNPKSSGVNSGMTGFEITNEKKKNGNFSGKLFYEFNNEPERYLVLENETGFFIPDSAVDVGLWIFGDFSENDLKFFFNDSFYVDMGPIDWYGWRYISYPLTQSSSIYNKFNGFSVSNSDDTDMSGSVYFDDLQFGGIATSVGFLDETVAEFNLSQNYPNPFNPFTSITFTIPESGLTKLTVYDILGNEVQILVNSFLNAGKYRTEFNGTGLASGIYFYKLTSGRLSKVNKMILIK